MIYEEKSTQVHTPEATNIDLISSTPTLGDQKHPAETRGVSQEKQTPRFSDITQSLTIVHNQISSQLMHLPCRNMQH